MRNSIPRIIIDVVVGEAKAQTDRRVEIIRIDAILEFINCDCLIEQIEVDDGTF